MGAFDDLVPQQQGGSNPFADLVPGVPSTMSTGLAGLPSTPPNVPVLGLPQKPLSPIIPGDLGYHGLSGGMVQPPQIRNPQDVSEGLYNTLAKGFSSLTSPLAVLTAPLLASKTLQPAIGALLAAQGAKGFGQGLGTYMGSQGLTPGQKTEQIGDIAQQGLMMLPGIAHPLFDDLVPKQPEAPRIPSPGDADYAAYHNNLSSRSPAANVVIKGSQQTAPSATTASPFDKGKLFQDSATVNKALQQAGLEKSINPGGAQADLPPAVKAQSEANNSPLNPGWGDLAPKPVTWKPALKFGDEIIPVDDHGQGWALKQRHFIEQARAQGLEGMDALKAADTNMKGAQRGFVGSDGKFYTVLDAARKQMEQTGKQNEKGNVEQQVQGLQTGQTLPEVQGSEKQIGLQKTNDGQVQEATKGKVPGAVGQPVGARSNGDVKGDGGLTKEQQDIEQRRLSEGGFTLAPKEIWKTLFSGNTGTKVDPGQMLARLRNVLGETSGTFKALQAAGLGQFLNQRRSVQEVQDWAEGQTPGVEVRKFSNYDTTKHSNEIAQLEHKLDTLGFNPKYNDDGDKVIGWEGVSGGINIKPETQKLMDEFRDSYNSIAKDSGAKSHWQSIAPKSEQDMPGYTEIAVVKKGKEANLGKSVETGKDIIHKQELFPSSHNFPSNTLGFVRGYMENINGKKVFHVFEVQSDWAQKIRDYKEQMQKDVDFGLADQSRANELIAHFVKQHSDVLIPQYERLALKAAIDHARSEGADAIAISDAETAMITEGHDRVNYEDLPDGDETPEELEQAKLKGKKEPSQAPGMRLHYDQTLPKIAGELTGEKGQPVDFGEHKMAMDITQERIGNTITELPKQTRKDLIFKNPDGTPKTSITARMFPLEKAKKDFSLYGRSGAIFPKAPKGTGKTLAQLAAAKNTPNAIVSAALEKLDSLKSTGEDIIKGITDTHAWKSALLRQQGYDLPKIEALSPKFANSVSKYANAQVSSALRANSNITQVLGDKINDEQFRKQLGGVIYEDMRRADGSKGNSVLSLKNSPFATEAQYQAALKNPEIQRALQGWKNLIQKPATEMHEKLGGTLAESGKETGAFGNLIAVLKDPVTSNIENAPSTVGPLSTMKKGSAFSRERQFTGQEYNLDAKDMAFRMMTKNAQQAALRDLYNVGENEGMLKLLKAGEQEPDNMIKAKHPVTLKTIVNKEGEVFHQQVFPAFDKRINSALHQALQLRNSMKDIIDSPLVHRLSQIAIKTQVALFIDLGFHTFNDMMAVATSPKGLHYLPKKALEAARVTQDMIRKTPELQEELAKMAESGVTFRGNSLGSFTSGTLKHIDTATRLILGREYQQLVKAGRVVDSPAEMRRYVNGRAGQYNKRLMTSFQQGMQETGLGAFNVAGRNFNRLAVNALTFSPGVKASSKIDALRLRASMAFGVATAALIVPATVNIALWGTPQPEGTTPGDIAISKNKDGTYKIINMRKYTMLARGGRATGTGDIMNEQVMPRLKGERPASLGQTTKDAAWDIGRTAVAPFAGPPLNVLSSAITGKSLVGYDQRSPGEKGPPYFGAAASSLNPLVGPLVNNQTGPSLGSRVGARLGSIVGIQSSQSPFSIIRNRAEQFKTANKIGSDANQSYGPSAYLPLKNALLKGDIDQAKAAYQQLLHDKSQNALLDDEEAKHLAMKDIQKEFSKMENFHFVNKESEAAFKAGLTPEQRNLYNTAIEQQKQMANDFFSQIQPKIDSSQPRGFKPMQFRKSRGFSGQF